MCEDGDVKLAEALAARADLQRRIEQLRSRIWDNARYQEGEEPAEDPAPGHAAAALADPVLDALGGAPATLDTLAQRTGLTLDALSAKLLTLELDGRIASLPGGRYQKIH